MGYFKKVIFFLILFQGFANNLTADTPYYLDFKYILNQSEAGKKSQKYLKKKLNDGIKKLKDKEKSIQEEEKKIIQQKKIISAEEYKKNVSSLQKERNELLESVAKQRSKARSELLKNLNPIMKEYMKANNIRMIVDKKSLLLADENLDLTQEIIKVLNSKLKSIKLD